MSSILFFLFVCSLVGPLVAGLLAITAKKDGAGQQLVQYVFAASAAAGLLFAGHLIWSSLVQGAAPLAVILPWLDGFQMTLDGWAGFFLLLVNGGVLLASLFAVKYLPHYASEYSLSSLNVASALFIFGMQATILSSSVLAFLCFWEVMSLSAYFLVIADRKEDSLRAGLLYLIMTHLGFACLLVGMFTLAQGNPSITIAGLALQASTLPMSQLGIAFFFLLAGFGSKAGLVPLHQWLPYAHPQAPSNSSALMSGVMLKVALYGFLRFVVLLFPGVPTAWAMVVLFVGLLSAFFGVLHASVENDLKRLLAWSSIENMGIVFAAIGLALIFRSHGLSMAPLLVVALLHSLNHAIFKSGLFLSAGSIISEIHTRNLNHLGGLAQAWPGLSKWFLGLVFAAAALPPFGTFYGEWLLLQNVAGSMSAFPLQIRIVFVCVLAVMGLVGGLAIFTFVNVFSAIFLGRPRSEHAGHVKALPTLLVMPAAVCAIASLVVGLFVSPITHLLNQLVVMQQSSTVSLSLQTAGGMVNPLSLLLALIIIGAGVMFVRRFSMNNAIRETGTWDCGQPITPRMEYTPSGFSAPVRFFFRSLLLSRNRMHTEQVVPGNKWIVSRKLEWSTHSVWEEFFYRPIIKTVMRISERTKRLQSGIVQFYLLLILVTLVIVLVVAL